MSEVLSVKLETDMDLRLTKLSKATGHSRSYYVKKALDEYLQDQEDYLSAIEILERNEPRTSIANVRKELGLEY